MKSYLDLIPISAKVHQKQTRMTRLCIIISVLLITTIFSMADMFIQSQKEQAIQNDGAWHVMFENLDNEQISLISSRPDVKTASRYAATNYRLDKDFSINGTKTVICGFDETFFELFPGIHLIDGTFPEYNNEALVSESVHNRIGLSVGDTVKLQTPSGILEIKITGFLEDTSNMLKGGAFGIFFNTEGYISHFETATLEEDIAYCVEFVPQCRIQKSISEICSELNIPSDKVAENAELMGLLLQSSDSYIISLYMIAAILAVLVAFSGMLMILGSLNSNVSQRTEFFGMMRCLGATKKQVKHFVQKEALSWSKTAIPIGLIISIVIVWILCSMLKWLSPTYFDAIPTFSVSFVGIISGILIGLITVLFASMSPAKKAEKVSPLSAVSGNGNTVFAVKKAANTKLFHVETSLGIHHAIGSKKNLILLTLSFAFSIILFLSFSIGIDFTGHALTALRPYTPDVSVVSKDNKCDIPNSLFLELKENKNINRIFGRSFSYDIPAKINGEEKNITLISYEDYQFGWAEGDLQAGNMEEVKNGFGVLLVTKPDFSAEIGDEIILETSIGEKNVTVSGLLNYSPFQSGENEGFLICSENLFHNLTGETGYTILDIQLKDTSDSVVDEIRSIAGNNYTFSDQRAGNNENRSIYFSFALFVYGFLAMIAMIAAFNIINSIDMSVTARMRQYGAMRAIGCSISQLKHMIKAETFTYLFFGLVSGTVIGIPLHYFLYQEVIVSRWNDPWVFPVHEFCIIVVVMAVSAVIAMIGPVKRIQKMSILDTISSQ